MAPFVGFVLPPPPECPPFWLFSSVCVSGRGVLMLSENRIGASYNTEAISLGFFQYSFHGWTLSWQDDNLKNRRILYDFFCTLCDTASSAALSDYAVSEDAGIQSKTVATLALAVRRSNCTRLEVIRRLLSDLNKVVGGGEGVQDLNGLGEGDVAHSEGPGQVVHDPAPAITGILCS